MHREKSSKDFFVSRSFIIILIFINGQFNQLHVQNVNEVDQMDTSVVRYDDNILVLLRVRVRIVHVDDRFVDKERNLLRTISLDIPVVSFGLI